MLLYGRGPRRLGIIQMITIQLILITIMIMILLLLIITIMTII